ncbi:hypothetical protein GCM10023168_11850 [Fodinibacter luteus]|uniref:Secreted protein n=1 Tax=Fodinibacter luteus TaxID=552064 RepID=A0ABP8K7V1_9MICO
MIRHTARQLLAPTAAAALIVLAGATSASAGQDVGTRTSAPKGQASSSCSLERVGSQLVRCDDLTGNGVAAPGWMRSGGAATTAVNAGVSSALVTETPEGASPEQDALTAFRRHGL